MSESLRSAFRQMWRNPGFAIAVVLTLAIGIGATTAVFTLADPMLFRPLPLPNADRLIRFRAAGGSSSAGSVGFLRLADALRIAAHHQGLEATCEFELSLWARIEGLGDESVSAYNAAEGCASMFGRPVRGRLFHADDFGTIDRMPDVALITHRFWQTAFGGADDVIGRRLQYAGPLPLAFEIVGVLPPNFVVPDIGAPQPGIVLPVHVDSSQQANPLRGSLLIATVKPGVSMEAVRDEAQAIVSAVEAEYPAFPQGRRVSIMPLQRWLFGNVRTPLLTLLAATACALLLACANLAQLFMARLHARQREIGVRLALGVGPWRLARHFIVEAAVLAVLGAAAGLVVAKWTFTFIMASTPDGAHVYRVLPAAIDLRVVGFAGLLTAFALGVYGVVPAVRATRSDVRSSLQVGGTSTPAWGRRDTLLIFLQTSMALALLVTGALIVRSYVYLATRDVGFEPDEVRWVEIEEASTPLTADAYRRLYASLRDELPVAVALTNGIPGLTVAGRGDRADVTEQPGRLAAYQTTTRFLDVFGIRQVRGRFFSEDEALANAPIAVVDERAAFTLWPGEDPLGKTIRTWEGSESTLRTVIGIVATVRRNLLNDGEGTAFVPFTSRGLGRVPYVVFRPGREAISLDQVSGAVHRASPAVRVAISRLRMFEGTLGHPRFLATLLGALSLVTIALTIVGIFGIVNHEVVRRTREVGIRMALGADAARIRRLVLLRALVPATAGVAAGILASLWWTRSLQALLYGLESHDVTSFAFAAALVLITVAVAGFFPAWRASRLQPTEALRAE